MKIKDKFITDSELEKEIDSFLHPISKEDFADEPFTLMAKCARHFVQWQKKQMVDKACEWLSEIEDGTTITDIKSFIEGFRKDMIG